MDTQIIIDFCPDGVESLELPLERSEQMSSKDLQSLASDLLAKMASGVAPEPDPLEYETPRLRSLTPKDIDDLLAVAAKSQTIKHPKDAGRPEFHQ